MSETKMNVDPARASALISQLKGVSERVAAVAKGRPRLKGVEPKSRVATQDYPMAFYRWSPVSIDNLKKAQLLDKYRGEKIKAEPETQKLNIHVQVNTSGEESKSGCAPGEELVSLCRSIVNDCPSLHLLGLMTIGAIARSVATTAENENEDFKVAGEAEGFGCQRTGLEQGTGVEHGHERGF
ncbi:hypothetical protein CHGG_08257 [Chaetomium globosum CBS 148.51]|uniref:Alanine racemase N-terminal domain-containing protein n=1 Tax=Chaetomium globosum (strain ATCC 6205 / CBS 148.51 / DSM 1962 / NBRC 6347 / NRRL 1970) TaxID=306901 RepID=Q2GUU7_CHAGB|nr:uncharacterized protein CHGG_08257 [Chaetomium globosum CBS 148.51]EAQ87004.1 hypothetical protein CHGG_08257 [Chaetomium globosum CBS 148.51]